MQDDKQAVTLDRPDRDRIEIVTNTAGIIISAHRIDRSILAYLLKLDLADHGHEAAVNTFLDWQLAYQATRGFKISNYDQRANSGGSDAEKASKYLRLIRKLGRDAQKEIENAIDPDPGNWTPSTLFPLRFFYLSALDKLGRAITAVRKEFDEGAKKPLAQEPETS